MMEIISVNTGKAQLIPGAEAAGESGIYKQPRSGSVEITTDGLINDAICHTKHHGGLDQAVYVYGQLDYDWWLKTTGRRFEPGSFGENLTISKLDSSLNVGDRLLIGEVVLEATAPRIPCANLAAKVGDMGFHKEFRAAGRPGIYCRVLNPGRVTAGDRVELQCHAGDTVSIKEVFAICYEPEPDKSSIQKLLNAPIAIRLRHQFEQQTN